MTTPGALTRERIILEIDAARRIREDWKIVAADAILALRDAELKVLRERFTAPVVCMCGSVRFRSTWASQMARLTDEGKIVLTVGRMLPKASGEFDPAHKERLDWLHKRKIDLADAVFVLDVGGYIGDSTRSEIAYAESIGRPVSYLSREFPDYVEPEGVGAIFREVESLRAQVHALTEEVAAERGQHQAMVEEKEDIAEWLDEAIAWLDREHVHVLGGSSVLAGLTQARALCRAEGSPVHPLRARVQAAERAVIEAAKRVAGAEHGNRVHLLDEIDSAVEALAALLGPKEGSGIERCPRCDSPEPHLHPAVQHEGEVHVCTHEFHSRSTNRTPVPGPKEGQ